MGGRLVELMGTDPSLANPIGGFPGGRVERIHRLHHLLHRDRLLFGIQGNLLNIQHHTIDRFCHIFDILPQLRFALIRRILLIARLRYLFRLL